MLFRCEFNNSYDNRENWTTVELVGDDFETAFIKRFGLSLLKRVRNIEVFDENKGEFVKVNYPKRG